jgi:hypothetical protein
MCGRELTETEWQDIERCYWRRRLVLALASRAVVETFREMTAHAPRAPFVLDEHTQCMRRVG